MANGPQDAIENATRLSEINFPEFTAKLITDTFNAITASYIDQMAQYVNLLQLVGQSLQDYINATRDDISADEINTFLATVAGLNDDALNFLLGDPATEPTAESGRGHSHQRRRGASSGCRSVGTPRRRRYPKQQ